MNYPQLPPGKTSESRAPEFADYWRTVRQSKGKLFLLALAAAAAGYFASGLQTPVYQARASLEIQGINENFLNLRAVNPNLGGASYTPEFDIHTQVRILQSDALLEHVARNMGIDRGAKRGADARADMFRAVAASLRVRVQMNTRIVELLASSADPKFAADFTNALAAAYIEDNIESRWQATENTGEWLQGQMKGLRQKLAKAEEDLQRFALTSGFVFASNGQNVAEDKLRQLQQEISRVQAQRVTAQSQFELASSAPAESLPEVLDSPVLRQHQVKLAQLQQELAELNATLTPRHPKVLKAAAQVASVEASLAKERGEILARIRNEYQSAKRREDLLARDYTTQAQLISGQAGKIAQYETLKREADTTRQIYDSMLQRVKEAGIASALRASNIRVVDPALAPDVPYRPKPLMNAAFGLFAGGTLGLMLVVSRTRKQRSFVDPGQTGCYLNARELAVIPSSKRLLTAGSVPAVTDKPSLFSDSFRAAVTSILFSGRNGNHPRVLVVTSPGPGEGKTVVAANLALALAQINRRVLLVDGDLRRPQLHARFGLEKKCGLSDWLSGTQPSGLPAQPTKTANLSVVTCGHEPDPQLLYSPRLAEFIAAAREQADIVVFDTPPMLQIPDARVLGRSADALILVVRAGRTAVETATMARQRCEDDGINVLGAILNDWNPNTTSADGYRRSYHSYSRYYQHKA